MIIGVDGGALSVRDTRLKVGVYRVTGELLKNLSRIDNKNNYRIFSYQGIGESEREWGKRMEFRVSPIPNGYMKLWMPYELWRHPVDVYLGLSQILPGSGLTSHIIDCDDVYPEKVNTGTAVRRLSGRSATHRSGTRRMKQIGFVYDLGFLFHPDAYPGSYRSLKRQTEDLVGRADAIVTISESSKRDIIATYGVPADSVTVAYPGVAAPFGRDGHVYRHPRPYFLYVGAIKRQKNITALLQAFAGLTKRSAKPFDLLLVGGDYWNDRQVAGTIASLGLKDRVVMKGFVPDTALASIYRGAVALVSPSLREGFCLPAAEAMASGCPVVGSASGAMPEVIGPAGILVDPSDISGLTGAMGKLAEGTALRGTLRTRALRRAKRFTWDGFARTVLKTVESQTGTDHGS